MPYYVGDDNFARRSARANVATGRAGKTSGEGQGQRGIPLVFGEAGYA